ncbi:MAG: CBS domain-containing protein, partial [archaeon]|nr:CBS domain-containing protein [archaeon]
TQDVMQRASQIVSLPLYGNTLHSLSRVLRRHLYSGYPVTDHGIFIGYVPYTDLKSRVDRKLEQGYDPQSVCNFDMTAPKPPSSSARSSAEPTLNTIDFADLFDRAPIQVSPHTPLRLIFHMFKSLGFRYILVVERGHLKGILTKKDILQYIALSFDKRIRTFLPSIENSGAIAHQSFASTFLSEDKLTSSSAEMRKLASAGINSLDDSV